MSSLAAAPPASEVNESVAREAIKGLTAQPRSLPPWLFYDERGSALFEQITLLPEYYLTRTERSIFAAHADEIIHLAADGDTVTLVELGAGTATKTGLLLGAAVRLQGSVRYHPIDVSSSALEIARENIEAHIAGVLVQPQLANYVTEPPTLHHETATRTLALYIGSSIGNFSPAEARQILTNLRSQLRPGDSLLLGTDLAPGPAKPLATILAAYDDAAQVTAAFNRNLLVRLNRELGTDFHPERFRHIARWNAAESRIEMHLESTLAQTVHIPASVAGSAQTLHLRQGESIHTENSYKFTESSLSGLFAATSFHRRKVFTDSGALFAVTLATAC